MRWSIRLLFMLTAFVCAASPARAIILSLSGQPRNTSAPTGTLSNSGWQWEGEWGPFLGTPIARNYFITAGHVGGNVGDDFTFGGNDYTTVATFDDPSSDLQIWKVDGNFPTWAPIYRGSSETGQLMVSYGRGTDRGSRVYVNGQVKGWLWGQPDGSESWGTNIVNGVETIPNNNGTGQGTVKNGAIDWTFNRIGTADESTLSNGDSGGGVFIKSGGRWQIAGVNFLVNALFSSPSSGGNFTAAIFDEGGLTDSNGNFIPDTTAEIPTESAATRISTRASWILNVIYGNATPSLVGPSGGEGVPEPSGAALFVISISTLLSRRKRRAIK